MLYPGKKGPFLPLSWSISILLGSSEDTVPHPQVHLAASKPWQQRFGVHHRHRERGASSASPASPGPKAAQLLRRARARRRAAAPLLPFSHQCLKTKELPSKK